MYNKAKKLGLSAIAFTAVIGLSLNSYSLTVQDPDNETSMFSSHTDVYVAPTNDGSFSDYESYNVTADNGNGNKTGLTYLKDIKSTNGELHYVADTDIAGSADDNTPNIKTSNKITFNTLYNGLSAGTLTGIEKLEYQRCQPAQDIDYSTFCTTATKSIPKAQGDIAMGSSFNVQYAAITTQAQATAIGDSTKLLPSMSYSIDVRGLGVIGQNDNAIGSAASGMVADITDYNGNTPTSITHYEQHTKASGMIKFTKQMSYNSSIKDLPSLQSNINKVP